MTEPDPDDPKPLLSTALAALDDAIALAVEARDTTEVNPVDAVRLESFVQMLRDQRWRLATIIEERRR